MTIKPVNIYDLATRIKALEDKPAPTPEVTKAEFDKLGKEVTDVEKRLTVIEPAVLPPATGVDATSPEHKFTPDGAAPPADLAALQAAKITPRAKFGVGEFVTLGDKSKASWDGSKWVKDPAPA